MTSSASYLARHHLSWCKMLNFLINLLDLKSLCKWTFWSWPSKIEKMCLLYEWCSSSHKKFSIFIIDSLTLWISNQTSLFMTNNIVHIWCNVRICLVFKHSFVSLNENVTKELVTKIEHLKNMAIFPQLNFPFLSWWEVLLSV